MALFPEEPLDSPQGYFPGKLNQKLNKGRWKIIRKLGWGPHSSCWLAVDTKERNNIEAIKIYTVASSTTETPVNHSAATNERDILKKMWDSDITFNVPVQRDSFYEESEVGRHLCLVLHVLGPSVVSLLEPGIPFLPLHIVKKAVAEIVEALCNLYEKGIIHGAVTPDNILLSSDQQGPAIREFISEHPSVPGKEVTDTQGKTYHVVQSQPLSTSGLSRQSTAVEFADFSMYLSNYSHARIRSQNIPLDGPAAFLPPEASNASAKVNTKADIWMLGCTIYTLIIGHHPFKDAPDSLTAQKVEKVVSNAEADILDTKAMSAQDAKNTTGIIKACLKFRAAERPTAMDLVGYQWVEEGNMCSCGWCSAKAS
ncbi:kinase-like domain-containing protein [Gymnopilus junonius]|uniref:non-specific serine/threonine protein kinase n=1 Tax=Gymnopilus junonius TaxID=109634 RepID=A0A9P5THG1_GYMJU|nr:kinase-like domain-containing protein [Gymnopilus junonius]